jgi:uncharacterized protein DUF222
MSTAAAFASVSEAMDAVRAGLAFVAAADPRELTAEEQAGCLLSLERANSALAAGRTSMLGAFTTGKGYAADADYSARAWLMHKTGITRGAAVAYTTWVKWAGRHPVLFAAMTAEQVSESYARTLCTWTDKLPPDQRDEADRILAEAAAAGMGLRDLAGLAAEILARCRLDEPDDDGKAFDDRSVTVRTTFQGAGVMHGDLTPECAAVVQSVLDALAAPVGADDDRTQGQRYHDALQEAMRRLVAGNLLPERAGQPVRALVHISLADLMRLEGSSALAQEWISGVRARWAAARAAAAESGSDGGAWLDGDSARAATCDASLTPVVTGEVDLGVLDELVRLCAHLGRLDGASDTHAGPGTPGGPGPQSPSLRDVLEQQVIGAAVALVSGPGGLASFLMAPPARRPARWAQPAAGRRRQPGYPSRDPPGGHRAGSALPVPGRLRPARRWLRSPPPDPQSRRREDLGVGLRAVLHLPPPGGNPPVGLDRGPEPRRHHHRLEQGQNQDPPQPRTTCPSRVGSG